MLKRLYSTSIHAAGNTRSNITPTLIHGTGLSAMVGRQAQSKPRDPLLRVLMNTKNTRIQSTAKRIYATLDRLNPNVLDFLYGDSCMIPQTFQSWFSITQLHVWMVQSRLRAEEDQRLGKSMDKALFDHFETDIEFKLQEGLHESGINNPRVFDRYLFQLLSQHYGCSLAYDEGYETSDALLASALWRNMYSMQDVDPRNLSNMVLYTRFQMDHIMNAHLDEIASPDFTLTAPEDPIIEEEQ